MTHPLSPVPLSVLAPIWRWVLGLCVWLVLGGLVAAHAQPPLELNADIQRAEAWPAVQILAESPNRLAISEVMASRDAFSTPTTAYATLGLSQGPVWVHVPIHVQPGAGGLWIVDVNYPVLNSVEFFLVHQGQVLQHRAQGNMAPFEQRRIPTPSHAFDVELPDGDRVDVYLRVSHNGALILPISFQRPRVFHQLVQGEQMLQGLLTGLALCLLVYSLGQWLILKDLLYGKYALLITGSLLFSLLHFGTGAQYVWGRVPWVEAHMSGLSAMIASTGSFLFNEHAMRGPELKPWLGRIMKWGAAFTACTGLAFALDLITIQTVTTITSTVGLTPALLAAPSALTRARRGDPMGGWFFVAWISHFVAAAILVEVIKGRIGVNPWTMHSYQIGATVDMLIFLRMLGLRTQALHNAMRHASLEQEALRSLAHTDPLTALLNRRGLHAGMGAVVHSATPDNLVAVFMLDLDGFKPINDQHGHDVGDTLLVAVATRLKNQVRNTDVVARMGGDEFVVLFTNLPNALQAADMGDKLLRAFSEPFVLPNGTVCHVGLTAGYAVAPEDGLDAHTLLRQADEAMYAGKSGGKHCVRRYGATANASAPATS